MTATVTGNDTRIVFCEGNETYIDSAGNAVEASPDPLLLKKLLLPSRGKHRIVIQPLAGKQAAKRFAQGFSTSAKQSNWLVFTDRDMDKPPTDGNTLQQWGNRAINTIYLTGLTSIENYAIDADLMKAYLQDWIKCDRIEDSEIEQSLKETVSNLAYYQACRWALQSIRETLQSEARDTDIIRANQLDLPNRLTSTDGKLPRDDNNHLLTEQCEIRGKEIISQFQNLAQSVDLDRFTQQYHLFLMKFQEDSFFSNGDFQGWYHGKDLLAHWIEHPLIRRCNVSKTKYLKWSVKNLDFSKYPDLIDFRDICWNQG